ILHPRAIRRLLLRSSGARHFSIRESATSSHSQHTYRHTRSFLRSVSVLRDSLYTRSAEATAVRVSKPLQPYLLLYVVHSDGLRCIYFHQLPDKKQLRLILNPDAEAVWETVDRQVAFAHATSWSDQEANLKVGADFPGVFFELEPEILT
ncbi:unnamed protein product, partial [Ectocarpus sp. 12 AP-2014]